jgi:hypothetical protein
MKKACNSLMFCALRLERLARFHRVRGSEGPGAWPLQRGSDAQRVQWSAGGGPNGLCYDGTRARRPGPPSAFFHPLLCLEGQA